MFNGHVLTSIDCIISLNGVWTCEHLFPQRGSTKVFNKQTRCSSNMLNDYPQKQDLQNHANIYYGRFKHLSSLRRSTQFRCCSKVTFYTEYYKYIVFMCDRKHFELVFLPLQFDHLFMLYFLFSNKLTTLYYCKNYDYIYIYNRIQN